MSIDTHISIIERYAHNTAVNKDAAPMLVDLYKVLDMATTVFVADDKIDGHIMSAGNSKVFTMLMTELPAHETWKLVSPIIVPMMSAMADQMIAASSAASRATR